MARRVRKYSGVGGRSACARNPGDDGGGPWCLTAAVADMKIFAPTRCQDIFKTA
jgi:hypothetical protein